MKNEFRSPACRHLMTFVAALLIGVYLTPAIGQTDEALLTACGRQAREAGVTGAAAVSAFVAACVAEKQAERTLLEDEKGKAGDKGKKDMEKSKKITKDKQKKEKKGKKDKKS